LTGFMAALYGLWIVYAAGLEYLLLSVVLYVPGILLFLYSNYKFNGRLTLSTAEKVILIVLLVIFGYAVIELPALLAA
ncbi:TPA: arginine:ornithine antiporter, partial [Mannheimia haemolytica]|nr:arginine:ornithine antiporter [Mannheimia haemolytica]